MAYVLLSNDDTGTYTDGNTLYVPEAWQIDITAIDAPIAYQLQAYDPNSPSANGAGLWLPEEMLWVVADSTGATRPCTIAGMARRCSGIQIRSLTQGVAASFQAVLIPPGEVSPDPVTAAQNVGWSGQRAGGLYPDPIPQR